MGLKILFATDRLHPPHDFSGSVTTTHELVVAMRERGHMPEVVASVPGIRHYLATAAYRASGRRWIAEWTDTLNGYPVHRGVNWRFAERVSRRIYKHRPDVLVIDAIRQLIALAKSAVDLSCPLVIMVHEVAFPDDAEIGVARYAPTFVANSPMTQACISERFGRQAEVVPPIVDLRRYIATRDHARFVTFISPKRIKGVDLVLDIAREAPNLPFLIVEGIPMPRHEWRELRQRCENLGNVQLMRSTGDMRSVYEQTRILLVPSQVSETFGRVVVEAQASGIPVVVRAVGALPWVVGQGGEVVPAAADSQDWLKAIKALVEDGTRYHDLGRMAAQNARRAEFDKESIVDTFERVVRTSLHRQPADNEPVEA